MAEKAERIKTYVKGLDERLAEGIPRGHIILLCGPTGSLKTSFAYSILYNNAKKEGRKGLYITMEQTAESLLTNMRSLNMGELKNIAIVDVGRMRTEYGDFVSQKIASGAKEISAGIFETRMDWFDALLTYITSHKQKHEFELLVIDSLDALYALVPMKNPRAVLFHFFSELKKFGATTFLVSEMSKVEGAYGTFGVEEFLSDGIIHLDLTRDGWNVKRFLNVVKLRGTKHDMDFYPLLVGKEGFEIVAK